MMAEEVITYICKRTVVSTKPVQPGKFHQLSVLDQVMEHSHLRSVYYYRLPPAGGEITKKLRESVAETLLCYPMVAGRLVPVRRNTDEEKDEEGGEEWMIKCNDAGVRMVEARARGSVDDWLKNVDRERELKLVHWEDMSDHRPFFWSTFYLQITEFEEGGIAIGLSCAHLLADVTSATMLLKAWADTTLGGKMVTPPLFHPLPPRRPGNMNPNHQPNTHLINHYKSSLEKNPIIVNPISTSTKLATITLSFPDDMTRACIAMASPPSGPDPSPFEALAALFWSCITKVKGTRLGEMDMSICVDMRGVLGLDKGFFGNCMVYNTVHYNNSDHGGDYCTNDIRKNDLSKRARAIRDVVKKMDNEGIMDLIEWLACNHRALPLLMNGQGLTCMNLEGLESYSPMFVDGSKTIHASYYIEPECGEGNVLVLPVSPDKGLFGRVVMVTLPEDQLLKLCGNTLISHFSPSVLMGMNKKF